MISNDEIAEEQHQHREDYKRVRTAHSQSFNSHVPIFLFRNGDVDLEGRFISQRASGSFSSNAW